MDDDDLAPGPAHLSPGAFDEATALLAGRRAPDPCLRSALVRSEPRNRDGAPLPHAGSALPCDRVAGHGGRPGDRPRRNGAALSRWKSSKGCTCARRARVIRASVRLGALCASADEEALERLDAYARCVGLAFQIQDDVPRPSRARLPFSARRPGADSALGQAHLPLRARIGRVPQKGSFPSRARPRPPVRLRCVRGHPAHAVGVRGDQGSVEELDERTRIRLESCASETATSRGSQMNRAFQPSEPAESRIARHPGQPRRAPDTDRQGGHQGDPPPGAGAGPLAGRSAYRRQLRHVREPSPQLQGNAHVEIRGGPEPPRVRNHRGVISEDADRDGAGARRRVPDTWRCAFRTS